MQRIKSGGKVVKSFGENRGNNMMKIKDKNGKVLILKGKVIAKSEGNSSMN